MIKLTVGEPYIPGKTSWPEGAEYNYDGNGHELRLFFGSPTEQEIRSVRRSPVHLALLVEGPIIDLVWRFEGFGDWSDCPYSIHLIPSDRRMTAPVTSGEQRALLQIVLVDAQTGILRAIRAVTLPPHATQRLHAAIREQEGQAFERSAYDAALQALYRRYPQTADMARAAEILVKGGT